MARYLMTHSLLSSWRYLLRGNPYEDATTERDPVDEFMRVLRREPTETTKAMQNGINFEDLVTAIIGGDADPMDNWYHAAERVARRCSGGILQYKATKKATVCGVDLLLYGRLDCLLAGEIIDIKFSKAYDPGKYFDSTQHPMYLELVPEAEKFTYLASNGSNVWAETYRRDETAPIYQDIQDFLLWLHRMGLMEIYMEKWRSYGD